MSKYLFLRGYKEWVLSDKTIKRSTINNRLATGNHLTDYMASANIPDFDLLECNVGIQLSMEELERRADFIEDFIGGFGHYLDFKGMMKSTKHLHWQNIATFLNQPRFKRINLIINVPTFGKMKVQPKDRISHLSLDQVAQILRYPANGSQHILSAKLCILTCWRASDICNIRLRDLEIGRWQNTRVYMINGINQKTGAGVQTPVPFKLISAIMKANGYDGSTPDDKYLVQFSGRSAPGMIRQVRLTNDIRKALYDVFSKNGLIKAIDWDGNQTVVPIHEYSRPVHLLRRSGATYYAANGLPPEQIALFFTGHRDVKTLMDFYLDKYSAYKQPALSGEFGTQNQNMHSTLNEVASGLVDVRAQKILTGLLDEFFENE